MQSVYMRASKKQLAYIASLCSQLDCTNQSLYRKYSLDMATKEIKRLKRKLAKQQTFERQTALF